MNIKKIMIFGGIGLVLAGVLGAGAMFVLPKLRGGEHHTEDPDAENVDAEIPIVAEPPTEKPATPPPTPAPVSESPEDEEDDDETKLVAANQTYIVPLPAAPGRKKTFLKAQISIIIRDEEFAKEMKSDDAFQNQKSRAEIRAMLLQTVADVGDDISEPETSTVFAQDVKDRLNELFKIKPSTDKKAPPRPEKPVKEVLIIDWMIAS